MDRLGLIIMNYYGLFFRLVILINTDYKFSLFKDEDIFSSEWWCKQKVHNQLYHLISYFIIATKYILKQFNCVFELNLYWYLFFCLAVILFHYLLINLLKGIVWIIISFIYQLISIFLFLSTSSLKKMVYL